MSLRERFEMGRLLTTKEVGNYYTSPGLVVRGKVQFEGCSIEEAARYQHLDPEALRAYIDAIKLGYEYFSVVR